jgi:putative methanogenesis marker protein 2
MVRAFSMDSPDVLADFGEDAAVIRSGDQALLLAADGIWSRLMEADPYWAGYCAVLVNIHDIAAMGGRPLAMVDVFSIADREICDRVIQGMREASLQFGVPIVGGHLHPDTPYSVIDVAILGTARLDAVIYSHTARAGDRVIAAVDLDGRVHPSCILNWDSVTMKSPTVVRAQIDCLRRLAEDGLVTAGKDISNPGLIGTLGMLLEVSGRGAVIDVDRIPVPDLAVHRISFDHWVRMYPGMGFVLTARPDAVAEVCARFEAVGMTARDIGAVDGSRRLSLVGSDGESTVFDLADSGIMRLGSCRGDAA